MLSDVQKQSALNHAKKGYGIETIPGLLEISPRVLNLMSQESEEVRDLLDQCISLQQLYWEDAAKRALQDQDKETRAHAQFMLNKIYNATLNSTIRSQFMTQQNATTNKGFIVDNKQDQLEILDKLLQSNTNKIQN